VTVAQGWLARRLGSGPWRTVRDAVGAEYLVDRGEQKKERGELCVNVTARAPSRIGAVRKAFVRHR
jgi:hypothetical protein